jgi:thiol-disulfide isomerase/thioredoxin
MKNRILIFTALLVTAAAFTVFQSCNSGASLNIKGSALNGTMANAEGIQLFFDHINYDNSNVVIAKVEIDNNGNFEIPIEKGLENGIYRIRIGVKKAYFVFDGTEKKVVVNGDLANFEKYKFDLEGSSTSKAFCDLMKKYTSKTIDNKGVADFIKSSSNPLMASFVMLKVFANDPDKIPLAKEVSNKLSAADPDSKYAKDYKKIVATQESNYAAMQANQKVQVGLPAPEINLESPDGKKYALSDLKGKIVLLDFWASWCGPCRKANPHVVETYKKYKDKGFTVYSVSLDGINPRLKNRFKTEEKIAEQMEKAKGRWIKAIEKDGLIWETHVSDLQHWNSIAAKTYGVRSIPQTFLINRDGKIAAINPRNNLEEAILKIL